MPFESLAQAGYMHAHPEILGKAGLAEWDAATKGKHLPHKVRSYEHGGVVSETGPAIVHRGEAILSRSDIMGIMSDLVDKVSSVGAKVVQPPASEAAGIKAKADNVKEYMDAVAQKPVPSTPAPAPGVSPDRINKHAKYGDRGGEKRIDVSSMTKPLASYKDGTASVPRTGPAMLHKGEAVIPAESNHMNPENWAGKIVDSEKPPKKLDHQKVRRAKTGGHIIEHHHTHPGHHPMEEHVKSSVADMAQHMTDSNSDPSGAGDPAAGAAANAAAAAPPAPGAGATPAM